MSKKRPDHSRRSGVPLGGGMRLNVSPGLLEQALALHQQGRWPEAFLLYDQVLARQPKQTDALFLSALIAAQTQRTAEAAKRFRQVVTLLPAHVEAHANLAVAQQQLGQFDLAIASYQRALVLRPNYAQAWSNLGNLWTQLQQWQQAIEACQSALQLDPDAIEARYNLGLACMGLNLFKEALAEFESILTRYPDHVMAHFHRGNALRELGNWTEAQLSFESAIQRAPEHAESHANLGLILKQLGHGTEALACLDEAIRLQQDVAEHHSHRAVILSDMQRHAEAMSSHERATILNPLSPQVWINMGITQLDFHAPEEALGCFDRAISIHPASAIAHFNRAHALKAVHRWHEAIDEYTKTIELDPSHSEAGWNRALTRLERKQFGLGWADFHHRKTLTDPTPIFWHAGVRRWEGGRPEGRVLVVAEQGIGDEVFLSKGLNLFERYGTAPACVTVDERLLPIFRRSYPHLRFEARAEVQALNAGDFDVQMALGDVASYLALDPGREPELSRPHLMADEGRVEVFKHSGQGQRRYRVGVSWKSKNAKLGSVKSMTLLQVMSVMQGLDVEWVNLQYGDVSEEIAEVGRALGVVVRQVPGVDVSQDLDGWMGLIAGCDAVITSSNSTAHFAGAVGKAGVVVVPFGKGKLWYWHLENGPSPWYGSLQVVHAQAPNAWEPALEQAKGWLRSHLESGL